MRTLELAAASDYLATFAKRRKKEPLIVTSGGKPVAALLPLSEGDVERASVGTNPKFLAIIEQSRARLKAEGGIPLEEMRRRVLGSSTPSKKSRSRAK